MGAAGPSNKMTAANTAVAAVKTTLVAYKAAIAA
jgi:hypothetical protein